ncbi:hypothetical protein GPALN_004524 [Globodera pallida]|nr:hypothetical protein GPALN_004524 [Globodera pallida]
MLLLAVQCKGRATGGSTNDQYILASFDKTVNFVNRGARWEIDVARQPLYPIRFWNLHRQAASALARTNNA